MTTCLARSVDASWFVRQGGLGRALPVQSHFAFPPLQQAGLVLWGRGKFLPEKQHRLLVPGGPVCTAARERERASPLKTAGWAAGPFCFKENKADLLSGLKAKRKTVSVETRWREKVVR